MNKFEIINAYNNSPPKDFLKQLLKSKEIKDNANLTKFIRHILDKIKEYTLYRTIGTIKTILPSKKKAGEPEIYNYTKTENYKSDIDRLFKALNISDIYRNSEMQQKYDVLKEYLNVVHPDFDIKSANIKVDRIGHIMIDDKAYRIMDLNEYKEFCDAVGSKDKFNELKGQGAIISKTKDNKYVIFDADNEAYKDIYYKMYPDELIEFEQDNKTIFDFDIPTDPNYYSDNMLSYDINNGTVINCYANYEDVNIPEKIKLEKPNIDNIIVGHEIPVTNIDMTAFHELNINNLHIPASISNINIMPDLADFSGIKSITVDENNKHFEIRNGNLCTKEGATLIRKNYDAEYFKNVSNRLYEQSKQNDGIRMTHKIILGDGSRMLISAVHSDKLARTKKGEGQLYLACLYDDNKPPKLIYTGTNIDDIDFIKACQIINKTGVKRETSDINHIFSEEKNIDFFKNKPKDYER